MLSQVPGWSRAAALATVGPPALLGASFPNSLGMGSVNCAELVGQGQEAAKWDSVFLTKPGTFLAENWCS